MPIPQFDARGLLPAGVHICTLSDLRAWAASTPDAQHRLMLVSKFEEFLDNVVRPFASGWPLIVDGSFVTDKTYPNDIDFSLDLRECEDPEILGKAFISIWNKHKENKEKYLVDGYPTLLGNSNFEDFFSYVGQKTGTIKGLSVKDRKGILRIEQW